MLLAALACGAAAVHAESDPDVEAMQRALVERGYDPGTIDGAMGQRTAGALEEFQRSVGLPGTGELDDATRAALGLAPRADSAPEPDAGATPPEVDAPRAEPAPERPEGLRLSFAALGWHPPQSGAAALARFDAMGAPPEFKRGTGTLFVPKGELVFVLQAGERIPGLDCDPGAGRLSMEFVFGPDGPVIFTPVAGDAYCQTGIGIAIEVGRTLEMRRVDWGDTQYPGGTVRITDGGLDYVR